MHYHDFKQKLLRAYSAANHLEKPVTVDDVDFINAGVWLQGACNAKVTIRAKGTSENFKGEDEIFYNRVRFDYIARALKLSQKKNAFKFTHEALPILRSTHGISVYETDFFNDPIAAGSTTFQLKPRIDSLVWMPPYAGVITYAE
jgi:hypothetical protein